MTDKTQSTPADETSLAREAAINADAFAELYRRHLTRVYRYHVAHTGNVYEISIDQPYIMDDVPSDNYIPPTAAIEEIDLAYYIRNPIYSMTDSNAGAHAQYLQPVWRFHGHYSNDDEFEILIQALKEEFLLPELAPYTPPG